MVWAYETVINVTSGFKAYPGATMAADVEQSANFLILAPNNNQRLISNFISEVVSRPRDAAGVSYEQPAFHKNSLKIDVEYGRVRIEWPLQRPL
jgi:hypothetical protein